MFAFPRLCHKARGTRQTATETTRQPRVMCSINLNKRIWLALLAKLWIFPFCCHSAWKDHSGHPPVCCNGVQCILHLYGLGRVEDGTIPAERRAVYRRRHPSGRRLLSLADFLEVSRQIAGNAVAFTLRVRLTNWSFNHGTDGYYLDYKTPNKWKNVPPRRPILMFQSVDFVPLKKHAFRHNVFFHHALQEYHEAPST